MDDSPFVIPETAHQRFLAQKRRRRRKEVREALALGATVAYDRQTLTDDGWSNRVIGKVTNRQMELTER